MSGGLNLWSGKMPYLGAKRPCLVRVVQPLCNQKSAKDTTA